MKKKKLKNGVIICNKRNIICTLVQISFCTWFLRGREVNSSPTWNRLERDTDYSVGEPSNPTPYHLQPDLPGCGACIAVQVLTHTLPCLLVLLLPLLGSLLQISWLAKIQNKWSCSTCVFSQINISNSSEITKWNNIKWLISVTDGAASIFKVFKMSFFIPM